MVIKIKTIDIRAIRGITNLELNLNEKNLIIHGENGTGKSSIAEAIEFFFTGTVSHIPEFISF
jgi:recombinational DNA repair ATPase RecF